MKSFIKKIILRASLFVLIPAVSFQLIGLAFNINIYQEFNGILENNLPPIYFENEFEQLNPFYHKKSGLWGYQDGKTSKVVVEPKYDETKEFQEDRARVKKDNLWGFIDKKGREVIEPQFDEANPFYEGLSRVKKISEYYGYIDYSGNIVISLQFNYATDFNEMKIARVGKFVDKKFRYFAINTNGERVSDYHENEKFMIEGE